MNGMIGASFVGESAALAQPCRESDLHRVASRIRSLELQIGETAARLNKIADKAYGPAPESVGMVGKDKLSELSAFASIDVAMTSLSDAVQAAEYAANRFADLA
jgi:hypothetical protein